MFLDAEQIRRSLKNLEAIHPFYGITFLACKLAELPVGNPIHFPISARETAFLNRYFKPLSQSDYYYRVFRKNDKKKHWVHSKKYASSTLQAMSTRTVFADAFMHTTRTDKWGWQPSYVDILKANLSQNLNPFKNKRVPAFDLAVWLYRDDDWMTGTTPQDIVEKFLMEFNINKVERDALFNTTVDGTDFNLQPQKVLGPSLLSLFRTAPPDVGPEEGGTLTHLDIRGVGPAKHLTFNPAKRLSLITGDNGLGKTFLLECAWWALTGQWADPNLPAYPREDARKNEPEIGFVISGETQTNEKISIPYEWDAPRVNKWAFPAKRPTIPGLLIYARVDGSFAVCDPVGRTEVVSENRARMPQSFVFTREQVWDGYEEPVQGHKRPRINGLIDDWVSWQNDPDPRTFDVFTKVLNRLSPPDVGDLGTLRVGKPVRLPDDSRKIPTLEHPYGVVPIVHSAAGVKRILTIAYLLVWAWNEHLINSAVARKEPQRRIVILLDELEAHLHPQWQRRILPALLDVKDDLAAEYDLEVQSIVATHSPLVMASAESIFDPEVDKLFHLDIVLGTDGNEVKLRELRFIRRGQVDFWLTSDVFELAQARSLEAEKAIEEAKRLQQVEDPPQELIARVTEDLQKCLSDIDTFWPRWTFFAEKHGVPV